MIRKPTEKDFREGAAVTALRETRKVAIEGSKGIGQGARKVLHTYLMIIFGFGLLMSLLPYLAGNRWMWVLGLIALVAVGWNRRARGPEKRESLLHDRKPQPAQPLRGVGLQSGTYECSIEALGRHAATLAIPALLMFVFANAFGGLHVPVTVIGIILFAQAVLLVARIFGDRTVVRFDAEAVVVQGLLGESRMLWNDADDIYVHTSSMFDLKVRFAAGTRQNVVIEATRNSMGGPTRLLVPIGLLGLDEEELTALITKLVSCRAAGGVTVPSWRQQAAPAPSPILPKVTPGGEPRDGCDPDAIIARHLAEREQIVAVTRPDLQSDQSPRKGFGRKVSR